MLSITAGGNPTVWLGNWTQTTVALEKNANLSVLFDAVVVHGGKCEWFSFCNQAKVTVTVVNLRDLLLLQIYKVFTNFLPKFHCPVAK